MTTATQPGAVGASQPQTQGQSVSATSEGRVIKAVLTQRHGPCLPCSWGSQARKGFWASTERSHHETALGPKRTAPSEGILALSSTTQVALWTQQFHI